MVAGVGFSLSRCVFHHLQARGMTVVTGVLRAGVLHGVRSDAGGEKSFLTRILSECSYVLLASTGQITRILRSFSYLGTMTGQLCTLPFIFFLHRGDFIVVSSFLVQIHIPSCQRTGFQMCT